jgi:hypothetical protein
MAVAVAAVFIVFFGVRRLLQHPSPEWLLSSDAIAHDCDLRKTLSTTANSHGSNAIVQEIICSSDRDATEYYFAFVHPIGADNGIDNLAFEYAPKFTGYMNYTLAPPPKVKWLSSDALEIFAVGTGHIGLQRAKVGDVTVTYHLR